MTDPTIERIDAALADMANTIAALRVNLQAETARLAEDTSDRPDGPPAQSRSHGGDEVRQ